MKLSSFKYYFHDAFKSLFRNKTISLASIVTVTATLFIMGIFLLTMLNINAGVSSVEDSVELKVFLKDDISISDQNNIENTLRNLQGVKEIKFESKKEALEKFKSQMNEKDRFLLSGYSDTKNPMPNSYVVKLDIPERAESVENSVKNISGVEDVGNDKDFIRKLVSISKAIRWIGLGIFILLVGVSLFLIGNTIRLTVFSRRREIGIMKFVGATDWFIRWPFVIEGVTIGIVGAIIANISIYSLYDFLYTKITESLIIANLISPSYILTSLSWQFIVSGAFIGALGSIISLRKFLAV